MESLTIRWTRVISLIGLIGLLVLAGITVVEALMRWLLDLPIVAVPDVSPFVITVAIASCFPLVFAERRNITVRLVGNILGPRPSMLLEAFGSLVAILIFSLMTWQLWVYTGEVAASNETTIAVQLPVAPWYRAATILVALCIPVQVLVFLGQMKSAFTSTVISEQKIEGQRESNREEKSS